MKVNRNKAYLGEAFRKKKSTLNIRVNSEDLKCLKRKDQHFDIRYQTVISELLHRVARS